MKNKLASTTLPITARGIVTSGRLASAPNAVALSKPTKLKTAVMIANPQLGKPPLMVSWVVSIDGPWRNSTMPTSVRMMPTEIASRTSIKMAETWTPR